MQSITLRLGASPQLPENLLYLKYSTTSFRAYRREILRLNRTAAFSGFVNPTGRAILG